MRTRSVFLSILLIAAPVGLPSARAGDVETQLRQAREKFAKMRRLEEFYLAKSVVANEIQGRQAYRGDVAAATRDAKIALDGFPKRRNSLQKQAFAEVNNRWMTGRNELNEIDRQVSALQAQMKQLDESALAQAAFEGRPAGPGNRRDILAAYPDAVRQCREAFVDLKAAATSAGDDQKGPEQVVREANASLNRTREGDAVFGPSTDFFATFKQFMKAGEVRTEEQPKSKGKPASRSKSKTKSR